MDQDQRNYFVAELRAISQNWVTKVELKCYPEDDIVLKQGLLSNKLRFKTRGEIVSNIPEMIRINFFDVRLISLIKGGETAFYKYRDKAYSDIKTQMDNFNLVNRIINFKFKELELKIMMSDTVDGMDEILKDFKDFVKINVDNFKKNYELKK